MPARLFVVHGSHPCVTVERALEIKGLAYTKVELPPAGHVLVQRAMFGGRTVPGIRFEGGEKVQGSRAILARIEQLAPEPPLLPADPDARTRVLAAERWGDEVLQPIARRILWSTMKDNAESAPSYTAGARLPMPAALAKALIPFVAKIEIRLNAATEGARAADLRALPGYLDRIDAWIADGTLGASPVPNRADLQIAPTLGLLMTMQDLRAIIGPRPAGQLADSVKRFDGSMPAGAIPPAELPVPA